MKEIVKKDASGIEETDKEPEVVKSSCPLGVSEVCADVYVCGAHACPGGVRALRPACVVNAAPELPDNPDAAHLDCYRRVPLLDVPDADIFCYLDEIADLIHETVSAGERVLVHCVAGVSRSVTLCLAFLMKYQRLTLREAYHHLKERRPQIRPNTGFFKQLIKYEQKLFGVTSVKMVYCEVIDKDIPDVYEPEYQGMAWFKKRYGAIIRT